MLAVKSITTADVTRLDHRYVNSTITAAYVAEWALEHFRLAFSPYKTTAIAGSGSKLDGHFLDVAKERGDYRAEIKAALLRELKRGVIVEPSCSGATRCVTTPIMVETLIFFWCSEHIKLEEMLIAADNKEVDKVEYA